MDVYITPLEHVLYQGVLNDQPLGRVRGGETVYLTMPLCFVARGRFAISARVRSVDGQGEIVGSHHVTCLASPEDP